MGLDSDSRDDRPNPSSRVTYDIDDRESPSEAVVRAVAAFTNRPPVELDPLYDVVDPDDLDEALDGPADSRTHAALSFAFEDCAVRVTTDAVSVGERDDSAEGGDSR